MKSNLTTSFIFTLVPRRFIVGGIAYLLIITFANCQSWQWGLSGGGGSDDFGSSLANENVYKMGTDAKGNLYVAWVGFGGGTKIGGDTVIGANGNEDCMISKFTCKGTHLWTKVIGNDIFQDGFNGFGVDSLGNTYAQIVGYDDGLFGFNIDSDTTFLNPSAVYQKRWWIVKYDSAGAFQWYKNPETDTASTGKGDGIDLSVMPDGTFYCLAGLLGNKTFINNFVPPKNGIYLLKFNSQGNIINGTFITKPINDLKLHIPNNQSRIYLSGSEFYNYFGKDTVGTIPIQGHSAICAFDMQGNQLWVAQFPDTGDANSPSFVAASGLRGKIITDGNGNVYFGVGGTIKVNNITNIAGYALLNDTHKVSQSVNFAFFEAIFKIDSNGNYVAHANEFQGVIRPDLGLEISGQKLIESGVYIKAKKGSFNLYKNFVFGINAPNIYLAELDINTMQYTKVDSLICNLPNSPTYIGIGNIHSDKNGQVYIGGQFPQDIVITGTTFNAIGGKTDMFIAKWGDTCGAYLLSNEKLTLNNLKESFDLYPNPATHQVNVSTNINVALSEVVVIIYDIMGKKVFSEKPKSNFTTTINTSQLPSGMYNVVLNSKGKLITSKKLIIER